MISHDCYNHHTAYIVLSFELKTEIVYGGVAVVGALDQSCRLCTKYAEPHEFDLMEYRRNY